MKNKKSLQWALTISNIIQTLIFVGLVFSVIMIGASMIFPSFGGAIEINPANYSAEKVFLTDLSIWMKVWYLVQLIVYFTISWLIIKEVIKILTSIKDTDTFYEGNVSSFRKLATYGIFLIIISSIQIGFGPEGSKISLSFPFGSILFTIACYLLADIFEEGKILMEENKSIV